MLMVWSCFSGSTTWREDDGDYAWVTSDAVQSGLLSKIAADQVIGSLVATRVNLGGNGIDQMAMRIKGVKQACLVQPRIRLNSLQRILGYKKRSFHYAIVSPEPHRATRRVVRAVRIWKAQCHNSA